VRFIADSMLGRLARWLRLLGYDTLYYPEIEDRILLKIAREDNRILLTRDTRLIKVRELQQNTEESREKGVERVQTKYFLLIENTPFDQLKTVITAFNLKDFSVMNRCAVCNAILDSITKEEVKNLVPEYVYHTSDIFKQCSNCGKLYWKGTHPEKFREKLSEILQNYRS
jgi:uncharacterized protein with PIN domain